MFYTLITRFSMANSSPFSLASHQSYVRVADANLKRTSIAREALLSRQDARRQTLQTLHASLADAPITGADRAFFPFATDFLCLSTVESLWKLDPEDERVDIIDQWEASLPNILEEVVKWQADLKQQLSFTVVNRLLDAGMQFSPSTLAKTQAHKSSAISSQPFVASTTLTNEDLETLGRFESQVLCSATSCGTLHDAANICTHLYEQHKTSTTTYRPFETSFIFSSAEWFRTLAALLDSTGLHADCITEKSLLELGDQFECSGCRAVSFRGPVQTSSLGWPGLVSPSLPRRQFGRFD